MKTVKELISKLQQYDPEDGILLFADIKIYKNPVIDSIEYIDTIPCNIGWSDIDEFYE
ncbi:MAG: hypothetical protein WC877_01150 [Dehalococcoidales bacterium]|jgi:hypothetical protein